MATFDIPGIGKVDRWWVYGGLGIAGGIAIWAYLRRSTSSTAVEPTYDPTTGAAYAPLPTDPAPYVNPAPATTVDPTIDNTTPDISTVQAWTQEALAQLGYVGMEPGGVSLALSRYLAEQPLNDDEKDIVRQAWAVAGKPPFLPEIRHGGEDGADDEPTGDQLPRVAGLRRQAFLFGGTRSHGRRTLVRWEKDPEATAVELQLVRNGLPVWNGLNSGTEQLFDTSQDTPYLVRARNFVPPESDMASGPWTELRFTTPDGD